LQSLVKGREFTSAGGGGRRFVAWSSGYTWRARIVVNEMTDFRQEFLGFALAR
jgi:hypothetical protein